MAVLKGADIDRFVAKPDSARAIVFVFGPDAGAVAERADAIVRASVDDPADPFAITRIEGDELAADPAKLIDEVQSVPMFGGRRVVRVRAGARSIAPAVEALLPLRIVDCRVVIEAGDLKRSAPLRTLCERAAAVTVIPCYADTERDIARLIDEEMRSAGLTLSPEARDALAPLLGGDRRASRNELLKLATYAQGTSRVEREDVIAVIADASGLAIDDIVDAAFAGRTEDLEKEFEKAVVSGTSTGSILFAMQRQVSALHKACLAIESGSSVSQQVDAMRPHFSRKAAFEAALRSWTASRLADAMQAIASAQFASRRQPLLADAIIQHALMALAVAARRARTSGARAR